MIVYQCGGCLGFYESDPCLSGSSRAICPRCNPEAWWNHPIYEPLAATQKKPGSGDNA